MAENGPWRAWPPRDKAVLLAQAEGSMPEGLRSGPQVRNMRASCEWRKQITDLKLRATYPEIRMGVRLGVMMGFVSV